MKMIHDRNFKTLLHYMWIISWIKIVHFVRKRSKLKTFQLNTYNITFLIPTKSISFNYAINTKSDINWLFNWIFHDTYYESDFEIKKPTIHGWIWIHDVIVTQYPLPLHYLVMMIHQTMQIFNNKPVHFNKTKQKFTHFNYILTYMLHYLFQSW